MPTESRFHNPMSAKTYTHGSNRAKGKESLERKVVYKSVLDNPLRIRWYVSSLVFDFNLKHSRPSVPVNVQNSLLARLVAILEGLAEYNSNRGHLNRQRKRALKGAQEGGAKPSKKRRKEGLQESSVDKPVSNDPHRLDASSSSVPVPVSVAEPSSMDVDGPVSEPPSIQQHLIVGINAVTKRLEFQAQSCRKHIQLSTRPAESANEEPLRTPIKIVFVCRADVDPPILIDHLPHLVAAINSAGAGGNVVLVPLPKGAELTLAAAICVRRVAVMAIDVSCAVNFVASYQANRSHRAIPQVYLPLTPF